MRIGEESLPGSDQKSKGNLMGTRLEGQRSTASDGSLRRRAFTVVAMLGLAAPVGLGQLTVRAAGEWLETAQMGPGGVPCPLCTVTVLSDGRVLMTGGFGGDGTQSTADAVIYSSSTDSWVPAKPMIQARQGHTATLLRNGEVLVVGGERGSYLREDPTRFLATAEIYSPKTDSWRAAGSMSARRFAHTATLLASGEVLVAGGYNNDSRRMDHGLETADLFDPTSSQPWSPTSRPMLIGRHLHTATLLADGAVLIAGGCGITNGGCADHVLGEVELYDPSRRLFLPTGAMVLQRMSHTASRLQDGRVVVAGGLIPGSPGQQQATATVEAYNPTLHSWTLTAPLAQARYAHAAVSLGNGNVLVAGGAANTLNDPFNGVAQRSTEIYDPAAARWLAADSLVRGQADAAYSPTQALVLLPDGCGARDGDALLADYGPDAQLLTRPRVTGLQPASGPSVGGTAVIVTGSGFQGPSPVTGVSFGGAAAPNFRIANDGTLTAISPPHAAGAVTVTVSTAAGSSPDCPGDMFTYDAPPLPGQPTITGLSPSCVPVSGGGQVVIAGTNLGGATAVDFGGSPARFSSSPGGGRLMATVPSHLAGPVAVSVRTAQGQASSPLLYADHCQIVVQTPSPVVQSLATDQVRAGTSATDPTHRIGPLGALKGGAAGPPGPAPPGSAGYAPSSAQAPGQALSAGMLMHPAGISNPSLSMKLEDERQVAPEPVSHGMVRRDGQVPAGVTFAGAAMALGGLGILCGARRRRAEWPACPRLASAGSPPAGPGGRWRCA